MKNKILLCAALVAIGATGIKSTYAADVTSWSDINANKSEASIIFQNDITATGTPNVLSLNAAIDQVIDGGGFSLIGTDNYHSISINNTANLIFKNMGSYTDGTSGDNTFSFKDLSGTTIYKKITASVNSFPTYLMTRYKDNVALSINNSVFTNNGGRIISLSGNNQTLNIKDSIFYNNSSNQNVAMISGKGIINVDNSIFYNNQNTKDDGGVFDISASTSILTITNSYFINNYSKAFGGAINQIAGILRIDNTLFEGNSSGEDGGAICLDTNINMIEYIRNSAFINNHNGGSYYDGGAISTTGGYIKEINNTVFDGNIAISGGGGVWGGMGSKHNAKDPVYIKSTTFKNNEAGAGGGYYTEGSARQNYTYIIDSAFTDNTVKKAGHYLSFGIPVGGGLISTGKVPMTIINTTFSGNIADTAAGYAAGGGIYFGGSKSASYPLKIVDSTFSNNSALEGGAIYSDNADMSVIAASNDVIFSGNTAGADASDYNGGADIYFDAGSYSATLSLNAADEKKIVFNGSVAAYENNGNTATININKSGVTYNTYDGTTETPVSAGVAGEIQFNARVGDGTQSFASINLYGGTLSIGQNATNNASVTNPDGYINDNNFCVKGDSTLSTVNNIIGEFAPLTFAIDNGITLDYQFDVDLANTKSDMIAITSNNGTLRLSSFNVISDSTTEGLEVKYSNTNVNGAVKDGYKITTSYKTYDVTAKNDDTGSYVVFTAQAGGGGLPDAIISGADQYIITDGQDAKVSAWTGPTGNVITSDLDINGNGHGIYTDSGINGMEVSPGVNTNLRNVSNLSGFNNGITNNGGNLSIIDSNVTGNTGTADVVNNGGNVDIIAKTKDVTIGSTPGAANALTSAGGTVNIKGDKQVTFNAPVTGSGGATMNIAANTEFNDTVSGMDVTQLKGTVGVGNFSGADYTMSGGKLNIRQGGSFSPGNFTLNKGTVNIADESAFSSAANNLSGGNINAANGNVGNLNLNALTLQNAVKLAVDVDMKKNVMDTLSATSVAGSGKINVNKFNLLSEVNKSKISLAFADANLKDHVATDVKTVEGKIFRYKVNYDSNTGNFNFSGGGSNSDGYSPSVIATPVAAQLQGYFTQLNSYDEAFRNMDAYMLMTSKDRQAMKNKNKYASLDEGILYDASLNRQERAEGWFRPYTTFENVPLKNGPRVSNVMYGAFVGGESEMYDLGHGWDGMWGVYVGYNGSHQAYKGISMYQNGGTLGLLGMVYKGNFFQGLTVNTGANAGEAHTKWGRDDFAMLMAGVASKTGYNFEFKDGKYIIQPNLLLSYSFANTFDYTNAAGVRISSDPLHAIQIEPTVKFIANLKNSWQPYASVGMVWNVMDKAKFKANDVSLPEMSVKPYVKYGVGIRKSWGERFTGFFQTYLTNGGRNGVGLQAGFTWTLGK